MELSARNQLKGTITAIKTDTIMAEVTLDVGGQTVVGAITHATVDRLNLQVGDQVSAIIKSTEVMIGE